MFTLDKTGTLTNGRFQVSQAADFVSVCPIWISHGYEAIAMHWLLQ